MDLVGPRRARQAAGETEGRNNLPQEDDMPTPGHRQDLEPDSIATGPEDLDDIDVESDLDADDDLDENELDDIEAEEDFAEEED
jgi:hypothetical protein